MSSISPSPSYGVFPPESTTSTSSSAPNVKVVGGIEEATGVQYSPISTLERQYESPFGQRICLFLSTNSECSVNGGVEAIWKLQKSSKNTGVPPIQPSNNHGLTQVTVGPNANNPFEQTSNGHEVTATAKGNPFEFLTDDAGNNRNSASASAPRSGNSTDGSLSGGPAEQTKKKGLGRMLKSMTKTAQSTLERGMQELAVRADQGRTPDLMTVFLFANKDGPPNQQQPNNPLELLGTTDPVPLPPVDPVTGKRTGMDFIIPVLLPPRVDDTSHVVLKLYIHSQASLVGVVGAKPKTKYYLVGAAYLQVGQLRQTVLQQRKAFFALPLHSNVVQDGLLQACALPDLKMPAIGQRGWSLTDPRLSGYACGLFNPPLDQPYALPPTIGAHTSASHNDPHTSHREWLIATERATESAVVLPLATAYAQLCAQACQLSVQHSQGIAAHLLAKRTEQNQVGQCARVNINVTGLVVDDPAWTSNYSNNNNVPATMSLVWQPPDSIFEVELVAPTPLPMMASVAQMQHGTTATSLQFFPPACRGGFLPAIWKAYGGQLPPAGFVLGNLRFNITAPTKRNGGNPRNLVENQNIQNPFAPHGNGKLEALWESIVVLENYGQAPPQQQQQPMQIPVYSLSTGHKIGSILLTLSVQLDPSSKPLPPPPSAQGGLVGLVGLEPLVDGVFPLVDFDTQEAHTQTEEAQRRQQQLATMGSFMSHAYLDQHIRSRREVDLKDFQDRARGYQEALKLSLSAAENAAKLPAYEQMVPRPFRPSSSRPENRLSAIPFNVHNASFSLEVMSPQDNNPQPQGGLFHNITCGAPSDHARGFGNVFSEKSFNSPIGSVSGGLRRLEGKRNELAQAIRAGQNKLTASVASFYQVARQERQYVNHVPARHAELQNLRWKVFEAAHAFHHVTWICAIRRANAFSQALGIAVSSYLTSLSDTARCQLGWPEIWARHGYLVSYEGLLSAAGNELGMIEDASVAIGMLRMVRIVLVRDDGAMIQPRVEVPHSPLLKWVQLTASASSSGLKPQYLLQIGIHGHYFDQRVPQCLQNGASVQLFPLLFQVGVDIRQWGANTGSQMKNQFGVEGKHDGGGMSSGGLLDEEDDDVGISDDDVLVALNYEALQKLNTYAHAISPIQGATAITSGISASIDSLCHWRPPEDQVLTAGAMSQPVHPSLAMLHSHIVTSAGKMNHSILDEAATMGQQLGGGGVVFCKSGKDRTAMHVTYKQAQFANRYRRQRSKLDDQIDATLEDATRMRIYGTRLPICEKNVGQALYAFNALQSKFMPDALKPPPSTLAGFLKGGRVFGQGGIES